MDESLINLAFVGIVSLVVLVAGLWHARKFGLLSAWPYFTVFGVCAGIALHKQEWSLWALGGGAVAFTLYTVVSARK